MKEVTDDFMLFHKELNDKVKEEGREKRALSKGVCTSVASVIFSGLTPMALEGSLCTEKAFLWMSCSASILSRAPLGFYGRIQGS